MFENVLKSISDILNDSLKVDNFFYACVGLVVVCFLFALIMSLAANKAGKFKKVAKNAVEQLQANPDIHELNSQCMVNLPIVAAQGWKRFLKKGGRPSDYFAYEVVLGQPLAQSFVSKASAFVRYASIAASAFAVCGSFLLDLSASTYNNFQHAVTMAFVVVLVGFILSAVMAVIKGAVCKKAFKTYVKFCEVLDEHLTTDSNAIPDMQVPYQAPESVEQESAPVVEPEVHIEYGQPNHVEPEVEVQVEQPYQHQEPVFDFAMQEPQKEEQAQVEEEEEDINEVIRRDIEREKQKRLEEERQAQEAQEREQEELLRQQEQEQEEQRAREMQEEQEQREREQAEALRFAQEQEQREREQAEAAAREEAARAAREQAAREQASANRENTIDELCAKIEQLCAAGAPPSTLKESALQLQQERRKPENQKPEIQRKLNEASALLLKSINRK